MEVKDEKMYLSMKDIVKLTGYSKAYLYKLTHTGLIPCYRPTGGKLFFKREEIIRWLENGGVPALTNSGVNSYAVRVAKSRLFR